MTFEINPIVDCHTLLGEGPLWDLAEQRLFWVDSYGQTIFRATAEGGEVRTWDVPQKIGSLALRRNGGAILSLVDGFYFFDFDTGECDLVAKVIHAGPAVRLNDGKVDRQGRFIVGSMDTSEREAHGRIYSVAADLRVSQIGDGVVVSNGPSWSPDGSTFYFSDSGASVILAYDYDAVTGKLANKREFCRFSEEDGLPDGATVDAEGYVWSAGVFKGKIHRFAPDGSRDRTIQMPVVSVTSVMFGGPDLSTLYVTTMKTPTSPGIVETGRQAGSLFAITGLGVRGLAENRFAG